MAPALTFPVGGQEPEGAREKEPVNDGHPRAMNRGNPSRDWHPRAPHTVLPRALKLWRLPPPSALHFTAWRPRRPSLHNLPWPHVSWGGGETEASRDPKGLKTYKDVVWRPSRKVELANLGVPSGCWGRGPLRCGPFPTHPLNPCTRAEPGAVREHGQG